MHAKTTTLSFAPEAPLPQRFLNPLAAYIAAAITQNPWTLLLQTGAAAVASYWQPLDDSFKLLAVAMAADFMTGVFAAWRRHRFSVRACWEGMVAKAMVLVLVASVGYVAHLTPGVIWLSRFLNFSMAAIDATSTLKNFRAARVRLPKWLESFVAKLEAFVMNQAEKRIESFEPKDGK